eukprot:1459644-Rhodomonas_salina.4
MDDDNAEEEEEEVVVVVVEEEEGGERVVAVVERRIILSWNFTSPSAAKNRSSSENLSAITDPSTPVERKPISSSKEIVR